VTATCYACDPANPHRTFDDSSSVARFPARFAGPPGNANGGIATGALACPALREAQRDGIANPRVARIVSRLRRGVPLEAPLGVAVGRTGDGYDVALSLAGDDLITGRVEIAASGGRAPGDVLSVAPSDRADVLREMSAVQTPDAPPFYEQTGDHPIPGCFSCGPANDVGMHIIPRYVDDGLISSDWRPDPSFTDGGRALAQYIIASALDCSSGICMPLHDQRELLARDEFFLLGSLDVRYLRVASVDAAYRVVGRALGRDGRKFYGLSALFDAGGTLYATAEAIWIVAGLKRAEAFGPK
jgi:hypothetical protein